MIQGRKNPVTPRPFSGPLGVFLCLSLLLGPQVSFSGTLSPISRTVIGLHLGMSETAFLKYHRAELVSQDPEFRQKVYTLRYITDTDVRQVTVNFYNKKLLKLDLEFTDSFVRTVEWFELVKRFNAKYGVSRITQMETPPHITDLLEWDDSRTHLVLRHVWQPDASAGELRSVYRLSYVDADYYVETLGVRAPMARLPQEGSFSSDSSYYTRD
ncbi:MAG TPA: hypothetical protein P5079_07740 [Elusimicrobiota bacterium]|nr:hypothetical protein [Elusimicrobiota bacterium]